MVPLSKILSMDPSSLRVASRWLSAKGISPLQLVRLLDPEDPRWGALYEMPIQKDTFVHFTLASRAKAIVEQGRLLMKPPHPKFGIDAVNAISTVYGEFIPGVQLTHLRSIAKREKDSIVALVFKTNTKPQYGMAEEVVWKRDVALQGARIFPLAKGVSLIMGSPVRLTGQQDQILYT